MGGLVSGIASSAIGNAGEMLMLGHPHESVSSSRYRPSG
jgi:hypothetical protein